MKRCGRCNAKNKDENRFCGNCGATLYVSKPAVASKRGID